MFRDATACNLASLNRMKFGNAPAGAVSTLLAFSMPVGRDDHAQEIPAWGGGWGQRIFTDFQTMRMRILRGHFGLGLLQPRRAADVQACRTTPRKARHCRRESPRVMCGSVRASSRIPERMGPFPGYEVKNREPMLDVIRITPEAMRGNP